MAFEKGHKKVGGKVKGSKNKDSDIKKAIKKLIPIDELIEEIKSLEEKRDKIDRLLKLLEFAHPKMKSVEHKGDVEIVGSVTIYKTYEADSKAN